jgi:glycosyltransferase involved in cell wall biosynthesis
LSNQPGSRAAGDAIRPLLLNTMDVEGGAAIATYRLHSALRRHGLDSRMLVQRKRSDDPTVIGPEGALARALARPRRALDQLPVRLYAAREPHLFSPAVVPDTLPRKINALAPDLVHLFWVTAGFLRPESFARFRRPIVWTLHDMWAFTGGCHYDADCGKFRAACGACPRLGSTRDRDLSRRVWERKQAAWSALDLTVVATSRWLADCARQSSLFARKRIEIIPNCVDLDVYRPKDKALARARFGLPLEKRLILLSAFGATSDSRKGFQHLLPALQQLASSGLHEDTELVVLGSARPSQAPDPGMRATYIPHLSDEGSQVQLYTAADVLVAPSVQENLSNTVLEALCCGTPVVAFDIGGMPDLVDHRRNGYLARPFDATDLAAGIAWTLEPGDRSGQLSTGARRSVEESFGYSQVAGRYHRLYSDLLA